MAPETTRSHLALEPFLHDDGDRIYNPITDRALVEGDRAFDIVSKIFRGAMPWDAAPRSVLDELVPDGWVVAANGEDAASRFLLKYVSLEAQMACNQKCYFCPVSTDPREAHTMPTDLYERIVAELAEFRATIEAVFMFSYNEPTLDRRFVDQVALLKARGLPPAVNTNATGLTPARVDAILAMGGLRYLSVNLSTLDRERYAKERGADQLELVLRNLDYLKDRDVAERMDMAVLGIGDDRHRSDFDAIRERFAGSRFSIKFFRVMDRAGQLEVGDKPASEERELRGCDNLGSRPLQHLHIDPYGRCLLCCEDYEAKYVVGDLTRQSVREVLTGPELAKMRRWVYGLERPPDDFICKKCVFAKTR